MTARLHPHTAYRRGLCVLCQRLRPAAGMTRCIFCHHEATGYRLTPDERERYLMYQMTGSLRDPQLYAVAAVIAAIMLRAPAIIRAAVPAA